MQDPANDPRPPTGDTTRSLASRLWPLQAACRDLQAVTRMMIHNPKGILPVSCGVCRARTTAQVHLMFPTRCDRPTSSFELPVCPSCCEGVEADLAAEWPPRTLPFGHRLALLAKRSLLMITADYLRLTTRACCPMQYCRECRRKSQAWVCTLVFSDFACVENDRQWAFFCTECVLGQVEWFREVVRYRGLIALFPQARLTGELAVPRDIVRVIWRLMCCLVTVEDGVWAMSCP